MLFVLGSRLDYADRVFLVAQWVITHLFANKRSFGYKVTGPAGMLVKEHKMKLRLDGKTLNCHQI
jgi:hypothetical protein